ncbi:glucose-1-phosphate adenylyltransferase family protein [Rhodococcus sp. IEGM 1408]|uniref:glucose-1-phosphate adenylyltransferase family protein n=1 Tax=Rhodococcus sp. IEGM 1408 TaxID=3082220 RepID=UPI002954E5B9|nr:sugar phosphate nucleotidyltransferase [Rhodococcus sp. IEGM 1408]MDV8000621.1 sugar phosphate nucleotidyltransferase [Rhodococcus sp. IEGM 1408]
MAPLSVVTVVLAGGAGSRLSALTRERAKPAVPYGAGYKLIDFVLSNAANSGLRDVWVVQQFHPVSLGAHLRSGRPWDLDRLDGGLLVLHPSQGTDRDGFHTGTADALWKQVESLREAAPQVTVVLSADAVYRLDYDEVIRDHLASFAEVTMVTTRVAPEDAGRYGVVRVAEDGSVVDYRYKPDEPESDLICAEIFVFNTAALIRHLEAAADDVASAGGPGDLGDIGDNILPAMVGAGHAREWRHEGYWRDVGTIASFWAGHMDLLGDDPVHRLDVDGWPLRTASSYTGPARTGSAAVVSGSLVGRGAVIHGEIRHSVVGPGAVIEQGALVRDSVILPGAVVRSGARVETAVVDSGVVVPAEASIGEPRAGATETTARVALLGRDEESSGERPSGFTLAAGEIHPGDDEDPRV